MEEMWTVRQIAEMCQVSENTVRNWANKGSIPAVRMGPRVWRFPVTAMEKLVGKQPVGGASK